MAQETFLIQRRMEAQINSLNHEAAQLRQQHGNSQARIRSVEQRNTQLKVRQPPLCSRTLRVWRLGYNPAVVAPVCG